MNPLLLALLGLLALSPVVYFIPRWAGGDLAIILLVGFAIGLIAGFVFLVSITCGWSEFIRRRAPPPATSPD